MLAIANAATPAPASDPVAPEEASDTIGPGPGPGVVHLLVLVRRYIVRRYKVLAAVPRARLALPARSTLLPPPCCLRPPRLESLSLRHQLHTTVVATSGLPSPAASSASSAAPPAPSEGAQVHVSLCRCILVVQPRSSAAHLAGLTAADTQKV